MNKKLLTFREQKLQDLRKKESEREITIAIYFTAFIGIVAMVASLTNLI